MDINIEQEAISLLEMIDDSLESVTAEFFMNFTERQYSDWLDAGYKPADFDALEKEIFHKALELLFNRWQKARETS